MEGMDNQNWQLLLECRVTLMGSGSRCAGPSGAASCQSLAGCPGQGIRLVCRVPQHHRAGRKGGLGAEATA